MNNLPKRKSIRLKHYDYSLPGWYYVTICTQDRKCVFGDIIGGEMVLNDAGEMIRDWWLKIPQRFENVVLDRYQIMPNHMHGIVVFSNGKNAKPPVGIDPCVDPQNVRYPGNGRTRRSAPTTLGDVIRWWKTMTTNQYIRGVRNNGWAPFNKRLWQRNFYENIIRTEGDLNKIGKYIKSNPQMWDRDRNNPRNWL